jgi:hypothetical protein
MRSRNCSWKHSNIYKLKACAAGKGSKSKFASIPCHSRHGQKLVNVLVYIGASFWDN